MTTTRTPPVNAEEARVILGTIAVMVALFATVAVVAQEPYMYSLVVVTGMYVVAAVAGMLALVVGLGR